MSGETGSVIMSNDTMREHLEGQIDDIRSWDLSQGDVDILLGLIVTHATSALAILDNAPKAMWEDRYAGRWIDDPAWLSDPVRLVGRVEPHDDNGDTT